MCTAHIFPVPHQPPQIPQCSVLHIVRLSCKTAMTQYISLNMFRGTDFNLSQSTQEVLKRFNIEDDSLGFEICLQENHLEKLDKKQVFNMLNRHYSNQQRKLLKMLHRLAFCTLSTLDDYEKYISRCEHELMIFKKKAEKDREIILLKKHRKELKSARRQMRMIQAQNGQ